MGRRKLSEEERTKSREKRLEYLRNYRKEHGPDYYKENKERILKRQRDRREKEKGSPLNSHNKINLKDMTKEERNEYYRQKMKESRARKREMNELYEKYVNQIKAIGQHLIDNAENIMEDMHTEHIREINIVSNIRVGEIPTVEINKSYIPRKIFEKGE